MNLATDPLEVATPWFEQHSFADDVTSIAEVHASEFLLSNSWHIRGTTSDLLFDCGLGVASMRDYVLVNVADREPTLVLSHAHLDHMGSAHEFARVGAHRAEPVAKPGHGSLLASRLLPDLGLRPSPEWPLPEVLLTALPHAGFSIEAYELRPATPTTPLEDGDLIDLGNRTLEVLHVPGHTAGSLALYEQETATLFGGDALFDGSLDGVALGKGADLDAYERTVRRLLGLRLERICLGHGEVMTQQRLHELGDAFLSGRSLDL